MSNKEYLTDIKKQFANKIIIVSKSMGEKIEENLFTMDEMSL